MHHFSERDLDSSIKESTQATEHSHSWLSAIQSKFNVAYIHITHTKTCLVRSFKHFKTLFCFSMPANKIIHCREFVLSVPSVYPHLYYVGRWDKRFRKFKVTFISKKCKGIVRYNALCIVKG